MRNLFINRIGRNTPKNNAIGTGPIHFDIHFINKKQTQRFDLDLILYYINITDVFSMSKIIL